MGLGLGSWSKKTLALSLAFMSAYVAHVWSYSFLNDDAYISFRYALNWVDFGEVTYNLGERVEGYTNFLWVALLALGYRLGADIPNLSIYLSIGLGLITVMGSALYSAHLESAVSKKQKRVLLTLILLSLSPSFACWTTGGLEVQLFTACYTLSVLLSVRAWQIQDQKNISSQQKSKAGVWAGSVLALASMTRPEGLLLFASLGLFRILSLGKQRAWLKASDYGAIIGFSLIYLPYFIWRYQYYGYAFPNTYYAKVGASGFWRPGLNYVGEYLLFHAWLPLVFALKAWFSLGKPKAADALCYKSKYLWPAFLISAFAHSLHVARVGGDFMALHRFLVPLLPLAAILASEYLVGLYKPSDANEQNVAKEQNIAKVQDMQTKNSIPKSLVLILGLLITLTSMAFYIHQDANRIGSRNGVDSIGWLRQFSEQCAITGKFIREHTDPKIKLATTAAGALPFYAQRYTLDLLGLNDEWIAHHVPARGHRPGHTKSAPFKYPIDQKIDLLVYHPSFSHRASRPSSRMQRALQPFGYEWKSYQVPQLQPSWWSVWQKKDVNIKSDLTHK